jgi:hypothetical protein
MTRRQGYTDAQLTDAVAQATSIRQVLARLGLAQAGGNYAVVKRRIKSLQLDTSHFSGKGWKRGDNRPIVPARPLTELLKAGTSVQSYKLKQRLFAERLKERRCESCETEEWLGQPVPLELDHINGDVTDNRVENLRILCPNCHALTKTYRGKKLAKCRDETAPS